MGVTNARRRGRYIARMEVCRPRLLQSAAAVFKRFTRRTDQHGSMKVRQLVRGASAQHRRKAGGVQTEEINSRHAFIEDVGAHIQLTKFSEKRQRRRQPGADTAHPEWSHRNPGGVLAEIEFQFFWDAWPDLLWS